MIIEGLLTTANQAGVPHVAPMGPLVDEQLRTWLLRPYRTSCTFQNLQLRPYCTFHIIDDVLPVVRLILGHDAGLLMDYHDCAHGYYAMLAVGFTWR